MSRVKRIYLFCIFAALAMVTLFAQSGCKKEYSYEGGALIDTIPAGPTDTLFIPPLTLPSCNECELNPDTDSTYWNLIFDNKILCGKITRAIGTSDKTGFTFFGPSKCSLDTGLVMSVALRIDTLNKNLSNVISNNVALEYYDNTTQTNFFQSMRQSITFKMKSYDHITGMASGSFSGTVILKDNSIAEVLNGNFVIRF
ncbi:hypothetical protein BH20BAC1_BH20BAC1_15720 [soil metagenome]